MKNLQQMKCPSGDMSFDLITEAKNHLANKHGLVTRNIGTSQTS